MEKRQTLELSDFEEFFAVGDTVRKVDRDNKIGLDALMILLWLKEAGTASPKRISSELNFNPPKTTRCIERLLRYNLVDENLNSADLRASNLSIAPKGWKVIAELERAADGVSIDELLDFSVRLRRALFRYNESHVDCKLTEGRARVLIALEFSEIPMTVSDICAYSKLKQPTVSMMVDWLVERDLVINDAGSSDTRTRGIRLTHCGKTAARALSDGL